MATQSIIVPEAAQSATGATSRGKSTLARTVMLANLTVRAWSGIRQDKSANAAISRAHGSAVESTRGSKYLISTKALAPVLSAAGAIRTKHYELTLPWTDDGARVLSSAAFFRYGQEMRPLIEAYADACDTLAQDYATLQAQARRDLGSLYNPRDYPQDIRGKFSAEVTYLPFPEAGDFRVAGIGAAEEEIRERLAALPQVMEQKAREEIGERVRDVTARIVDRLTGYTGTKAGSFRDSLLENVRDLVDILPLLNITGDPKVAEVIKALEGIGANDVDDLREDKALRDSVVAEAEGILDSMKDFI